MVIGADSSQLLYEHDMNKPSMNMDFFVAATNVTANQLRSLSGVVVARTQTSKRRVNEEPRRSERLRKLKPVPTTS